MKPHLASASITTLHRHAYTLCSIGFACLFGFAAQSAYAQSTESVLDCNGTLSRTYPSRHPGQDGNCFANTIYTLDTPICDAVANVLLNGRPTLLQRTLVPPTLTPENKVVTRAIPITMGGPRFTLLVPLAQQAMSTTNRLDIGLATEDARRVVSVNTEIECRKTMNAATITQRTNAVEAVHNRPDAHWRVLLENFVNLKNCMCVTQANDPKRCYDDSW